MRGLRIFFVVLFSSVTLLSYGQGNIDVLHYKFNIELNDRDDSIKGVADISFVIKKNTDTIYFDLKAFNSKNGMLVENVTLNKPGIETPSLGHQKDDKIVLGMTRTMEKGDTASVSIVYRGIPADGLIISKNKYGRRTFFADNWPNRAHHWIPCVDDPSDKATVEFIVTAPSHYQVVSNGIMIEETNLADNKKLTHYREDVPLPTKVMVIGVADFAVNLAGTVDCIPVYSWVFPEEKKKGFYDYALAKDILTYYIDYIGPFPYKKLANVQSKTIFGGMENAGAIFYHENSVDGKRSEEYLLAHEIVHQWFGDMATEKNFPHLWLSEGFATYLTHVYAESRLGFEKFNERMKEDRDQVIDFVRTSPKPVVDSVTPYLQLLNANSYQRGSWVLHMLRRELGDSVFQRCVRSYYEQYKGKNADTKDLQVVFEKVSGKKLETFFKQWLHTADIPRLDISWKYDSKEKNLLVTIKQLQKSGPFSFPLAIYIQQWASDATIPVITVDKEQQTFIVSLVAKPIQVKFDPYASLLFEGRVTELK
ncbi:MAG: M1 family peptidase [Chitinophagaceae bacterium]|nr:M1 family peptidase [Chitinophagaceae bacterium]